MNKTNKMELDSILNSHINNIFSVHQHSLLLLILFTTKAPIGLFATCLFIIQQLSRHMLVE